MPQKTNSQRDKLSCETFRGGLFRTYSDQKLTTV